ncbi:Fic family protein [Candidatus Parcubacteria bacterium]|nr:Fic family protein [Candidatus Parcubacteria bacterium]
MNFRLQKPNLNKIKKDDISKVFVSGGKTEIRSFINLVSESEYLYWDKIQYKEPSPKNVQKEILWYLIKFLREQKSIKTPIKDENKKKFTWSKLDYFEEFLHKVDMNTGGELFVGSSDLDKVNKQKLITRGIIEEAIASSQLEGASTSRMAAKKMLREGRNPINKSEQMIVNNYISMKAVEEGYKDREMSMDLFLELHGLIIKDTLDDQGEKPRLRQKDELICVSDKINGMIYHKAPKMEFVKKELKKMVDFANDDLDTGIFIHPVIKAIMLHFWIGYLHPFTDGNGRLARLLFYWYLIKKGYWAFIYLPISKVIKKSPNQYTMAYVYSEQDDNDLTYFINYNFGKIKLALKDFIEYVESQAKNNLRMKGKSEERYNFNMRQVQLLQYLYGDPDGRTNLKAHMSINRVSNKTAIGDLKGLLKKGFLTSKKQGKYVYYYAADKIKELF